jgi:hypothetical protein
LAFVGFLEASQVVEALFVDFPEVSVTTRRWLHFLWLCLMKASWTWCIKLNVAIGGKSSKPSLLLQPPPQIYS